MPGWRLRRLEDHPIRDPQRKNSHRRRATAGGGSPGRRPRVCVPASRSRGRRPAPQGLERSLHRRRVRRHGQDHREGHPVASRLTLLCSGIELPWRRAGLGVTTSDALGAQACSSALGRFARHRDAHGDEGAASRGGATTAGTTSACITPGGLPTFAPARAPACRPTRAVRAGRNAPVVTPDETAGASAANDRGASPGTPRRRRLEAQDLRDHRHRLAGPQRFARAPRLTTDARRRYPRRRPIGVDGVGL